MAGCSIGQVKLKRFSLMFSVFQVVLILLASVQGLIFPQFGLKQSLDAIKGGGGSQHHDSGGTGEISEPPEVWKQASCQQQVRTSVLAL